MECSDCLYYESFLRMPIDDVWNRCNLTGAENFLTKKDCDLVDDIGGEKNGEIYKR